MTRDAELLSRTQLFQGLPTEVLERFAALGTHRRYKAGDVVFAEMSEGDELFLILEGEAGVQLALANRDPAYDMIRLGPGELLGEVSFVEKGQRSATVTAESDLEVLVWDCDAWRQECDRDPRVGYPLALGFARILAARLRRWNVKLLEESLWGF
jgi:CRP-like cAMP-binding protein